MTDDIIPDNVLLDDERFFYKLHETISFTVVYFTRESQSKFNLAAYV